MRRSVTNNHLQIVPNHAGNHGVENLKSRSQCDGIGFSYCLKGGVFVKSEYEDRIELSAVRVAPRAIGIQALPSTTVCLSKSKEDEARVGDDCEDMIDVVR